MDLYDLQRGTVLQFDEKRQFGFILPEGKSTKDKVFFHLNDGLPLVVANGEAQWGKLHNGIRTMVPKLKDAEGPADEIFYDAIPQEGKGPKAVRWTYIYDVEDAYQELQALYATA
jgi:hypothetical protein